MSKKEVEKSKGDLKKKKSKGKSENAIDQFEIKDFSEILRRNWKVFRVSPLYNFNHSKLKRYEHKLSEDLNATRKLNSKIVYKARFSLSEKLRPNENCTEAIKIEINDNENRVVYCAYFISWANNKDVGKNYISLPILLVNSKGSAMETIHASLCQMFDCVVQPVILSFSLLITLFVDQLQNPRKHVKISEDLIFMEYKIPGCKDSDRLKVSLFLQDIIIILAMIIDDVREKLEHVNDEDIVLEFYNCLVTHLFNVYQMDLMQAELYKIAFPDSIITTDGHVKMSSNEVALLLLKDLQRFTPLEKMMSI